MKNKILAFTLSAVMLFFGTVPVMAMEDAAVDSQPDETTELQQEESAELQQAELVVQGDGSKIKKMIEGIVKVVDGVVHFKDNDDETITLSEGVYYIDETSFADEGEENWKPYVKPIVVADDANVEIIVKDGMEVHINEGSVKQDHCAGIYVPEDGSLTLTPGNDEDKEVKGTGKIYAYGTGEASGIGGCNADDQDESNGAVTINGLTVYAIAGRTSAGIGGTNKGDGGEITINGGTVYAFAGDSQLAQKQGAAGIGAGPNAKTTAESAEWCNVSGDTGTGGGHHITINGGTVYAFADDGGAGIGGGYSSAGHAIQINGGKVRAVGYGGGAGIGGGRFARGYNIEITGGDVVAIGAKGNESMTNPYKFLGAGIGGGSEHRGTGINITGGKVLAVTGVGFKEQGYKYAESDSGYRSDPDNINYIVNSLESKYYSLKSNYEGAGIGGGCGNSYGEGKYIYIAGNKTEVTALAAYGAAIGGAYKSNGTQITIGKGATVKAYTDNPHIYDAYTIMYGKGQGAAIGGGGEGKGYDIEINEAKCVDVYSNLGAGIGCGYSESVKASTGTVNVYCRNGEDLYVHSKAAQDKPAIGSGKGRGQQYGEDLLRTHDNSTINVYRTYENGEYKDMLEKAGDNAVYGGHAYKELWIVNATSKERSVRLGEQNPVPTVGYQAVCKYFMNLVNIDRDPDEYTFNWYSDENKTEKASAPENANCYITDKHIACIAIEPDKDAKDYNIVPAGTYYFSVTVLDNDSGKKIESNVQKFTVKKQDVSISSASASKYYDGKPLTAEEIIQDKVVVMSTEDSAGNKVEVKDTVVDEGSDFASITEVGTADNTYSYNVKSKYDKDNYNITATNGTLTVHKNALTAEITGYSGKYDGKAHSVAVKLTDKNGQDYAKKASIKYYTSKDKENWTEYSPSAGEPDIPEAKDVIESKYVKATATVNSTTVESNVCKLEIKPRSLELKSESKTREYDETALTAPDVKIGGDGFVDGEGFAEGEEPIATGSITTVGSVTNTIIKSKQNLESQYSTTYQPKDGTDLVNNYSITTSEGTLKVTKKSAPITITTASAEKKYDGTALEADSFTYTQNILCSGDALTVDVNGSITYAGTDKNTIKETKDESGAVTDKGYKVTNASGEDVTDCYTFAEPVLGKLTVYPRKLTVTSGSGYDIKDGDFTSLSVPTYTISGDGFIDSDKGEGNIEKCLKAENFTEVTSVTEQPVDNEFDCYFDTGSQQLTEAQKETLRAKANSYEIEKAYGQLFVVGELSVYGQDYYGEYDGQEHGEAATVIGGSTLGGSIDLIYYTSTDGTNYSKSGDDGKTIPKIKDAGTLYVKVTAQSGQGIQKTEAKYTLTVVPREITVATASDTKQYDGTALTKNAETDWNIVSGSFVQSDGINVTINGSQTLVGESKNSFTYTFSDGTVKENYKICEQSGTLAVTQNLSPVKVTTGSGKQKYTGYALTNPDYTVNASMYNSENKTLFNGDTLEVVTGGTITDVGKVDNTVKSLRVFNSAGKDVTDCYTIATPALGTLRIVPRAITIKTASAEKTYDGTPLTDSHYTVLGDGFVGSDEMTVSVTGTRTKAGTSANGATYEFTDGTNADNYNVTVEKGTLTVNKRNVTLTSGSAIFEYDGNPHSEASYTVSGDGFAQGEGVNCSNYKPVTDKTTDDAPYYVDNTFDYEFDSNTESGNYVVTQKYGRLVVYQGSVPEGVSNPDSYAGVYDGKAHGGTLYDLGDGFTKTFKVKYEESGTYQSIECDPAVGPTRTDVGKTWVEVTATEGATQGTAYYTIEITKKPIAVKAGSATKVYDGTALTCQDYTITDGSLVAGETLKLNSTSSITDVGSTDNVAVKEDITISKAGDEDSTGNYNITSVEPGTLEVTKRSVVLVSGSLGLDGNLVYDGESHESHSVTEVKAEGTGFVDSQGVGYTDMKTFKDAGTYSNSFKYTATAGTNLNNYDISTQFGTIQIARRDVTLTSGSGVYKYDAKTHSNDTVVVSGAGFVKNEVAVDSNNILKDTASNGLTCSDFTKVKAVTTASEDQLVDNEFSYEYTGETNAKAENYNITQNYGKLMVYAGGEEGVVSPDSYQGVYDGKAHKGTLRDLGEGITKTFEIRDANDPEGKFVPTGNDGKDEPSRTDAGTTIVKVTASRTSLQPEAKLATNTVDENQFLEGTAYYAITVLPRSVTLTSDSATKYYNGKPLSKKSVTVGGDGFVEGEGADYADFAEITDVGKCSNTFSYTLKPGTRAENYTISQGYGTLTVLKATTLSKAIDGIKTGDMAPVMPIILLLVASGLAAALALRRRKS